MIQGLSLSLSCYLLRIALDLEQGHLPDQIVRSPLHVLACHKQLTLRKSLHAIDILWALLPQVVGLRLPLISSILLLGGEERHLALSEHVLLPHASIRVLAGGLSLLLVSLVEFLLADVDLLLDQELLLLLLLSPLSERL